MLAALRRVDAPQRHGVAMRNPDPVGDQVVRLQRMGFTVLVEGEPEKIRAESSPVIGDVLVEVANNVIRHADPQHPCVVSVVRDPLGVGLQVTNVVATPEATVSPLAPSGCCSSMTVRCVPISPGPESARSAIGWPPGGCREPARI